MLSPAGGRVSEPADWLGVDVGWIYPAVDSDGTIYRWAKRRERFTVDVTLASPVIIRTADGDTIVRDPYTPAQLADINARAKRNDDRLIVHQIVNRIVGRACKTDRGIALEDWSTFKTRRSAWVDVYRAVIKVSDQRGVAVRTVNRAWTSLTCPVCAFVDKVNRPERGTFLCGHCGHTGQADHVAATNIRQRAVDGQQVNLDQAAHCANPACCNLELFRKGLCLRCTFYRQRQGRYPTAEQIARLEWAATYREFVRVNELDGITDWSKVVANRVAKPRSEAGWVPAFARQNRPSAEVWAALKERVFYASRTCAICGHWPADELDFSMIDGDFGLHNLRPVCRKHRTPLPAIAWQIRDRRTR